MQDLQDEGALSDANHLSTVARGPVPRAANCLKQDLQDEQDLQDYAVLLVTNSLGLEDLHVYSLPNFFLAKN